MSKNNPVRVTANTTGESLTKQAPTKEADINHIVSRHLRGTGRSLRGIGAGGDRQPMFGDFSNIDYHAMLNQVSRIDNAFMQLPPKLRARFNNRPELLINFVSDPNNLKEAVKLGLMDPPEGYLMTPSRDLVRQEDLVAQADNPPPATPPAVPKADDEANPTFKQGGDKK